MTCSGRHEAVPAGEVIPRSGITSSMAERGGRWGTSQRGTELLQTLKGDRRSCAQTNGLISATFIAGAALSTLWKALGPFRAPRTSDG